MSIGWEFRSLLEPLDAERPCGENLEDTHLLFSFDGYRLFGRSMPYDTSEDDARTRVGQPDLPPDWVDLERRAIEALRRSKDLRLLAHLAAAALRTQGLHAFCASLDAAASWLERWWVETYPPVDEDALLRRNALNLFADRIAILDDLQRLPLVRSRQHGTVSLRDLESAGGREAGADERQVEAAFAAMPPDELSALHASASGGLAAVRRITHAMRDHAGIEAAPELEPLGALLAGIDRLLAVQVALRPPAERAVDGGQDAGAASVAGYAGGTGPSSRLEPGVVGSREDAVRAIDRAIEYFRRHEPSSPVPLLLERAKRLIAKDFLEVIADLAPDGLGQVRAAGGLPPAES